jgi:ubiquinone/menaquinone biosynthesis C-methylase UbiE
MKIQSRKKIKMNQKLKYTDYIAHYEADAEYQAYFIVDKFEEQAIRRRYEQFSHLYKIKPGDRILEVGSGGGKALKIMKKGKASYYPLDISLKNLKRISQQADITIFPITGDVFLLPFRDSSFHLIILSEVLEHLENPVAALRELKRVVKDNKNIIISVPFRERITYQLCIHCNKLTPTSTHLHSFDEQKLSRLLIDVDLMPEKTIKIGNKAANRLYLYILLNKLPFILWKPFDRLFNIILPKQSHLIIMARKK